MLVAGDVPLAHKHYYTHARHDVFDPGRISPRMFVLLDRQAPRLLGLQPERIRPKNGYLHDRPPGAVRDIGCCSGDFTAAMQSQGWTVRGMNVDPHAATAATRNHRFRVGGGKLETFAYPDDSVDAVTSKHGIEPLRIPKALLLECWRILRGSKRIRVGKYEAVRSCTCMVMKFGFWQFPEVGTIRRGHSDCGEELVLIAAQPATALAAGSPFPDTVQRESGDFPLARMVFNRHDAFDADAEAEQSVAKQRVMHFFQNQ